MASTISIEGGRRIVLPSNVNMLFEHFAMAKKSPEMGNRNRRERPPHDGDDDDDDDDLSI